MRPAAAPRDAHDECIRIVDVSLEIVGVPIILLEKVTTLSPVGQDRCVFVGLPFKIRSRTGSPTRVAALTEAPDPTGQR